MYFVGLDSFKSASHFHKRLDRNTYFKKISIFNFIYKNVYNNTYKHNITLELKKIWNKWIKIAKKKILNINGLEEIK